MATIPVVVHRQLELHQEVGMSQDHRHRLESFLVPLVMKCMFEIIDY